MLSHRDGVQGDLLTKHRMDEKGLNHPKTYIDDTNGQVAAGWYRQTRNPFYAWEVLAACLKGDRPIPDEVKPYFVEVCQTFDRLTRDRKPPVDWRAEVTKSVVPPQQGRGSAFQRYRSERRNRDIVFAVDEMKLRGAYQSGQQTLLDIFALVARAYSLERVTVKKIYEQHNFNGQWSIEHVGSPRPRKSNKRA